jgi:hypothetical protein
MEYNEVPKEKKKNPWGTNEVPQKTICIRSKKI